MTRELEYKNSKMLDLFKEVLKVQKPDIVHFHSIQQLSASLVEACINLKIPYIITLHDMWWLCEKQFMIMDNGKYCAQKSISLDYCMDNCATDKKFTKERYEYLYPLLKKADLLLAPSKFQSSMYLSENIDHNKIIVNKNGILFPNDNFKKIRDNKEIIRFAYLGGNAIHKGYNWLKDIFESINYDNYELNLVDLHKKLGLTSIQELDWDIQGKLTISDGYEYGQKGLDDFFSNIDVLLFPSQWKESFGLTVREALVRDVWVISTDAGGVIEDIIDGENGNIVSMQDQEKFKNYIISILKNPLFFENYQNRYKNDIRSFKKQSLELKTYYERVLKDR
jgi:glycosyltransferase involved in cell wall biosynthesis